MTAPGFHDILRIMKTIAVLLLFLVLAPTVRAAEFDLGFARSGMTLDEFRAGAWPDGTIVRCSGEADLPPESDDVRLAVPDPVARLGGTRCGLFHQSGTQWHPSVIQVAGIETQVWGKFFPDRSGTPRLMHLVLRQPAAAFGVLADYFGERFGEPELRRDNLARWQEPEAEVAIIVDGGILLAFVIDTRLQAALHARTSHHIRRTEAREKQK